MSTVLTSSDFWDWDDLRDPTKRSPTSLTMEKILAYTKSSSLALDDLWFVTRDPRHEVSCSINKNSVKMSRRDLDYDNEIWIQSYIRTREECHDAEIEYDSCWNGNSDVFDKIMDVESLTHIQIKRLSLKRLEYDIFDRSWKWNDWIIDSPGKVEYLNRGRAFPHISSRTRSNDENETRERRIKEYWRWQ